MTEPRIINMEEKGDKIIITYGHDLTPILEHNYELRKNTRHIWRSKKKNPIGEYVGRIPIDVLEDWIAKGFVHGSGCLCGCTHQMRKKMLFAMLNKNPNYKTTQKTL